MNRLAPQDVLAWIADPERYGYNGCLCGDCAPKDACIDFVLALAEEHRDCATHGPDYDPTRGQACDWVEVARLLKKALER